MNRLKFVNVFMTVCCFAYVSSQSCLADQKAGKDVSAGKALNVGKDLKVGKDVKAGKDLNVGKPVNTGAKPLGLGNCPMERGGSTSGNKDEDDYDKMRNELNKFMKDDAFKGPTNTHKADRDTINHRKDAMDKHPGRHLHKANEYDTKGTYY